MIYQWIWGHYCCFLSVFCLLPSGLAFAKSTFQRLCLVKFRTTLLNEIHCQQNKNNKTISEEQKAMDYYFMRIDQMYRQFYMLMSENDKIKKKATEQLQQYEFQYIN